MSKLKLRKFDMSSIPDHKIVVFIGKRGTGKSFLVKDFLWHKRDIPVGAVISPTEEANGYYGDFMPSLFIHPEYTPKVLNNFIMRQKNLVHKIKKGAIDEEEVDIRSFLIFDDCLFDDSWAKDKNMRLIFMNGRHYKITFLLTMQYPLGIKPHLRTNIDYVFILRENITKNRMRIYENYAGMFPSFDAFSQAMDQCTENFECLVIANNANSNRLEDQVFWYKAEPHPDFKLGAPVFWNYSKENENPDGSDDELDLTTMKKSNFSLVVEKLEND